VLRLPAYSQFSKEQVAIDDLPAEGNYLVIGPPGTGKTVLALYRSSRLAKSANGTQFLAYGKPLSQYVHQAASATSLEGTANTFHSWFANWYRRAYRRFPPKVVGRPYDHDWDQIYPQLARGVPADARLSNLIIDEGQDLPVEFYLAVQLIADNITVFADENQSIKETNSTVCDLIDHLNPRQVRTLTTNYRNSLQIASLSREFFTGTHSGIPDLPPRRGESPILLHSIPFERQIAYIISYERTHSDRDIGVLVENVDTLVRMHSLLEGRTINPVQAYARKLGMTELQFGQRGIKLLAFQSAKGLEFDTVFLPALERTRHPLSLRERMTWYVLSSRARDELYFLTADVGVPIPLRDVPSALYSAETLSPDAIPTSGALSASRQTRPTPPTAPKAPGRSSGSVPTPPSPRPGSQLPSDSPVPAAPAPTLATDAQLRQLAAHLRSRNAVPRQGKP